MRINIANRRILDKILERKKKDEQFLETLDLKEMLKNILSLANRFVPSESGSVLLDDPTLSPERQKQGVLYFVACFGKGSRVIVGTGLPSNVGIAGRTYSTGKAYISKKVKYDSHFYPAIDKKTKFHTQSIVCAPIKINEVTVGVIELFNRLNRINFDENDLTLLRIFAENTSAFIQNSLDAKRFGELSIKDNLTGLYNDRYFFSRLDKELVAAIRRKSSVSLIFLDLDRFKEVNDTHGHLAGSRVLAEVGALIRDSLYKINAIPARYGGDEFIVIMPDTGSEAAADYAERLRKTVEENIFLKHRYQGDEKALKIAGQITASMGIASFKGNGFTKSDIKDIRNAIIKQADSAMYRSKETGRNKITVAGLD